ncbi:CGNR zinc finger domain-containing protein [Plantactinospora sp. GCM10030261]|uniref:CGNR zinc finger domain-containing protein n=1 Tax=Plantactinospora sp. GCM10030261 TaxID=3273420 RepID=UPI00361306CF
MADLSVDFANTVYLRRGRTQDAIGDPEGLADWLRDRRLVTGGDDASHTDVLRLRDAVRRLFAALAEGRSPDTNDVAELNVAAAQAPTWPELRVDGDQTLLLHHTHATGRRALLADVARDAMRVIEAATTHPLRRCAAPACVVLYHPERASQRWCSSACGNRARVARHHATRRGAPAPPT